MSAHALMYRLKARCREADIHVHESKLLAAGANITAAQRLAGHQSPAATA